MLKSYYLFCQKCSASPIKRRDTPCFNDFSASASVSRCGSLSTGGCDLSRRCTHGSSPADGRSGTETTMRSVEVVVLQPRREMAGGPHQRGRCNGFCFER